ncbi:MAG: L,D-transpeptidase [Mycobacterium sp.]
MRRAAHHLVVVAGLVLSAIAGSAAVGAAAVPTDDPDFAVAAVSPPEGAVVGVGHPVQVTFAGAVADRQAAEQSIGIATSSDVTGHFTWLSSDTVEWTPDSFWPAHSRVTVTATGLSTFFQAGAAVLGVADISDHTFTITVDNQVLRSMPASMGKPGFATPVGTFAALEKQRTVTMDSRTIGIPLESAEGYLIEAEYAVRVTWGGVYVHSAPWSVGSQGNANVSHGCINLSPYNAGWYFDMVQVGDPIVIQT